MIQTVSMTMIASSPLLAASSEMRLFDSLWNARERGPDQLKEALEKRVLDNVLRGMPTGRSAVIEFTGIRRRGIRDKNVGRFYADLLPIPPVMHGYAVLELVLPALTVMASVIAAVALFPENAEIEDQTLSTILWLVNGFSIGYLLNRLARRGMRASEGKWVKHQMSETWRQIYAAGKAAATWDRPMERHLLSLAAMGLYQDAQSEAEVAQPAGDLLAKFAKQRGSHYAGHYLWLLRQEGYDSGVTDLGRWKLTDELLLRFLQDDKAAIAAINLAVRESRHFGNAFVKAMKGKGYNSRNDETVALAEKLKRGKKKRRKG